MEEWTAFAQKVAGGEKKARPLLPGRPIRGQAFPSPGGGEAPEGLEGAGGPGFDLVVDKSTTDALLCDVQHGMSTVRKAMAQVAKLVLPGGCLFLVSHNSLPPDERGRNGQSKRRPAWFNAVARGLQEGDTASSAMQWALEVHRPTSTSGPTVYLFRRQRRSARGTLGGSAALLWTEHEYR